MDGLLVQAEQFFTHYGSIFDKGDMLVFSKFFTEPYISLRPDGTIESMPTNESAKVCFESELSRWTDEGYKRFLTKDYDISPIGRNSMLGHLLIIQRCPSNFVMGNA